MLVLLQPFSEKPLKLLIRPILTKNSLLGIAAQHDMVERTGVEESEFSGHAVSIARITLKQQV